MARKLGLALGGGSALGNAHLGVLQSLADHEISIDCISGTSAGAVVAACYAFGITPEAMKATAEKLSWRAISEFSFSKMGLISNEALGEYLKQLIGNPKIENANIPLAIIATDIVSGDKIIFRKGSVLEAVRASAAIPGIFTPVPWKNHYLVDGGLVENVPMSPLREMGADIKIGVNVKRWMSKEVPTNLLDIAQKSIDIMSRHTIPAGKDEIMIEPHLEEFSASDFKKTAELASHGYRATTLKIPEIRMMLLEPKETLLTRFGKWLLKE